MFSTCSTSYTWLTRHVTKHVGSKPFLCIVDGCRQRFGNQVKQKIRKAKSDLNVYSYSSSPGHVSSSRQFSFQKSHRHWVRLAKRPQSEEAVGSVISAKVLYPQKSAEDTQKQP